MNTGMEPLDFHDGVKVQLEGPDDVTTKGVL